MATAVKSKVVTKAATATSAVETPATTETKLSPLERSRALVKPLRDAGIAATAYGRGPFGSDTFSLAISQDSETVRMWAGTANVVVVDVVKEPKSQVILRVSEDKHDVEFQIRIPADSRQANPSSSEEIGRHCTINLPVGTTFKLKNKKWETKSRRVAYSRSPITERLNTGIAVVPKFDNSFLIGYDEVKCFVAQLPKHVTSVVEAHKALRPAGIGKKAVRQGEWFFDPVSAELAHDLDAQVKAMDKKHLDAFNTAKSLEARSTHQATFLEIGGVKYVRGIVHDNRKSRHENLVLDGWHRVVRNLEVVAPITPIQQRRGQPEPMFREQRRGWD